MTPYRYVKTRITFIFQIVVFVSFRACLSVSPDPCSSFCFLCQLISSYSQLLPDHTVIEDALQYFTPCHFASIRKTRPDTRQSSRGRLGRSSNAKTVHNYRISDRPTDTSRCRVACQRLKRMPFLFRILHQSDVPKIKV